MLGGHFFELAIVLGMALLVFGPKRLPELGSSLGGGIREFRKATSGREEPRQLIDETQEQEAATAPTERA